MPRILVPRSKKDTAIIEAFECSRCEWEYRMEMQEPGVIPYNEVARAVWKFDGHKCALYELRATAHLVRRVEMAV